MSSPLIYPKTPASSRNPLHYRPLNSSPLAESPKSSPVAAAQARRKSQYKAQYPTTPLTSRSVSSTRSASRRLFTSNNNVSTHSTGPVESDPQKVFLRDRLKARCLERAVKAREKAIRGKRYGSLSEPGSDDFSMDDDDDEGDEDIMQDELFRRIMANANRKKDHSYRVSYAQEVGSSFDPDMEDVGSWEQELAAAASSSTDSRATSMPLASTSGSLPPSDFNWLEEEEQEELTPVDLDDEELMAYAEECARQAALDDFEGILVDDLFSWDDDDTATPTQSDALQHDDTMDMS